MTCLGLLVSALMPSTTAAMLMIVPVTIIQFAFSGGPAVQALLAFRPRADGRWLPAPSDRWLIRLSGHAPAAGSASR